MGRRAFLAHRRNARHLRRHPRRASCRPQGRADPICVLRRTGTIPPSPIHDGVRWKKGCRMNWTVLNARMWIEGTFATLWIGNRSDTGALVIVKCLRDKTPDNRRYFSREGRVLRGRFHRRMVEFLGGDLDGPDPYYIMPYYDGGHLTVWAGRMTHGQLRLVALHLAETLANLHAAEVIHGDFKPDNTFVTK